MMGLLVIVQSAIDAVAPWLASAAVVFALMALGARIAERGAHCEALAQFKRLGLLWQVFIVLSVGSATRWAGAKGDRGVPTQPSEPPQVVEPSIAPIAVYTNGVSFVSATSNAVELATWRTIGGTEMGAWIESPTNAPFWFWILLDTAANSYEAGPTLYGNWCGTGEDASVGMSPRPPDVPSQPSPTDFGAKYSVASFHCHTPTTYRPATTNFPGRKVGPSKDDKRVDKYVDHVPGIVYDYLDSPDGSWNIPPEHPINSPAGIYESFGEERRPTP